MAPEVIDGLTSQTKWSDMYAAGAILHRILDNNLVNHLPRGQKHALNTIAYNCRCMEYSRRFSAQKALRCIQQIM